MTSAAIVSPALLQRSQFATDFVWGSATSSYQIEGAVTEGGRVPSIWDHFTAQSGTIRDASSGAIACDHYHRWPEDLDLAQHLGLNAYRFSIAWPRIMGSRHGASNQAGLDFYSRLVDGMLERGITPWATLYHWDLPQYLQDAGGWQTRDTVQAFTDYVDVITHHLGDRVKHWITHNEPWCTAMLGNFEGIHAPGQRDLGAALQVCHHVLLSHGLAIPIIRGNVPEAQVGIALSLHPQRAASETPLDRAAAERHDGIRFRWFLDPLYGRGYPEEISQLFGKAAPVVHAGDMAAIATPTDFLGVNYYFPEVIAHDEHGPLLQTKLVHDAGVERTAFGWEVAPQGLPELLQRIHANYQPGPIYITENGSTYEDVLTPSGAVLDTQRSEYLRRHLLAMRDAIAAGIPVQGYFAWSLLDNFEWAEGYVRRFGLTYIDFITQQRTLKQSGEHYRALLHGAPWSAPSDMP